MTIYGQSAQRQALRASVGGNYSGGKRLRLIDSYKVDKNLHVTSSGVLLRDEPPLLPCSCPCGKTWQGVKQRVIFIIVPHYDVHGGLAGTLGATYAAVCVCAYVCVCVCVCERERKGKKVCCGYFMSQVVNILSVLIKYWSMSLCWIYLQTTSFGPNKLRQKSAFG